MFEAAIQRAHVWRRVDPALGIEIGNERIFPMRVGIIGCGNSELPFA
jgi:hypothetical protein